MEKNTRGRAITFYANVLFLLLCLLFVCGDNYIQNESYIVKNSFKRDPIRPTSRGRCRMTLCHNRSNWWLVGKKRLRRLRFYS